MRRGSVGNAFDAGECGPAEAVGEVPMILLDGLEQSLLCCNLVHERYGVHAISRCFY